MEHKIGEIITLSDGKKAEVVEGLCENCVYHKIGYEFYCDIPRQYECMANYRTDHKNIIYKEIKEG